jgi:phytoene/squalene synthetase
MKFFYDQVSQKCSKVITKSYSTSFSLGISFLAKKFHAPIYGIYGFVRIADEIVDSFHDFDKAKLLQEFKEETFKAIENKISTNPILNSFQEVVNKFDIDLELIETFLKSMEMDLNKSTYNQENYEEYILGSAEVVGLMCLKVFIEGNQNEYEKLKPSAMKLGSAFQKINFLRDFKDDKNALGRTYFPQLKNASLSNQVKKEIEADVLKDFLLGYEGIKKLPKDARFGVYLAYTYYLKLLNKIEKMPSETIELKRVRISNKRKYYIFLASYIKHSFNFI